MSLSSPALRDHPLVCFPDFRRLFLGRLVSAVGDKFFTIALAWWVVSQGTDDSKFHLGLLMAVNLAPIVLLGPVMGTLTDRLDRRSCMLVADLARATTVGLLWWALWGGWLSLPILYLLVFLTSAFSPLFESAAESSLADLTDEAHLGRAVAADGLVLHLSGALGACAGSLLFAWIGVAGAILLNAVSFLLSFCFVWRLRTGLPPRSSPEPYLRQMAEGFSFTVSNRPILAFTAVFALLNFFAAPLLFFIPLLAKFRFDSGASLVALFEGAFAVGSVGAALGLSFRNPFARPYPAIFGAVACMGLAMLGVGLSHDRGTLLLLFLFTGACVALINALALGRFQASVPPQMKGRFFAILTTVCFAASPLSYLLSGVATQQMSLDTLILMDGALTLLLAAPILLIPRLPEGVPVPAA